MRSKRGSIDQLIMRVSGYIDLNNKWADGLATAADQREDRIVWLLENKNYLTVSVDLSIDLYSPPLSLRFLGVMVSVGNSIQFNKITLASLDMHSYEAMDRTLQNLSMVDETLNYVNQRFTNQQEQYRQKISGYVDRLAICQQKIAALQEGKRAIIFTTPS